MVARDALILLWKIIHGEMDALELASGDAEIARVLGAHRQNYCLICRAHIFERPDGSVDQELDSLGPHLLDAAVDPVLLHLEVGDAISQQPPNTIGLLEHRHRVARARQLLGGGQPGRSRSDHRHALTGFVSGRFGMNPPLLPCIIDHGALDDLDRHRRLTDAQYARGFTRCGTNAPREFREIVGGVEHPDGVVPAPAERQIVPIRNDVVEGAAGVAKGHSAVHAARALGLDFLKRELLVYLEPVVDALRYGAALRSFASVFKKPADFTHVPPLAASRPTLAYIHAGTPSRIWEAASPNSPGSSWRAGFRCARRGAQSSSAPPRHLFLRVLPDPRWSDCIWFPGTRRFRRAHRRCRRSCPPRSSCRYR